MMGAGHTRLIMSIAIGVTLGSGCGISPGPQNSAADGSRTSSSNHPHSGSAKNRHTPASPTTKTKVIPSKNTKLKILSTGKSSTPLVATKKATKMGRKPHPSLIRHKKSRVAAPKRVSLATLPKVMSLAPFNRHLKAYHAISAFIPEMGYHWATIVPGIVYMTNQHTQITGVEATFPQNLGSFSWYDPPTPPTILNASLAMRSEHLYFVPPSSITPVMSPTMPTALGSWSAFVANNPRLSAYVKEPARYHKDSVYGPPGGPGIDVLVATNGSISGFLVAEPAMWGYSPLYLKTTPLPPKVYSKAYYSLFLLQPPTTTRAPTKNA